MNIQTVIANLLTTIEGKERLLALYQSADPIIDRDARILAEASVALIKINLKELNAILNDCIAVREADIVKDLEIKELQRQNSDYSWMVNPDRMGQ